jgi:hypothetical protein
LYGKRTIHSTAFLSSGISQFKLEKEITIFKLLWSTICTPTSALAFIMIGHIQIGRLQIRFIPAGFIDAALKVIRDNQFRNPPKNSSART